MGVSDRVVLSIRRSKNFVAPEKSNFKKIFDPNTFIVTPFRNKKCKYVDSFQQWWRPIAISLFSSALWSGGELWMKPLFHGVSSDHRIPKYRRNQKQNCHTNQIHVGLFSSPQGRVVGGWTKSPQRVDHKRGVCLRWKIFTQIQMMVHPQKNLFHQAFPFQNSVEKAVWFKPQLD